MSDETPEMKAFRARMEALRKQIAPIRERLAEANDTMTMTLCERTGSPMNEMSTVVYESLGSLGEITPEFEGLFRDLNNFLQISDGSGNALLNERFVIARMRWICGWEEAKKRGEDLKPHARSGLWEWFVVDIDDVATMETFLRLDQHPDAPTIRALAARLAPVRHPLPDERDARWVPMECLFLITYVFVEKHRRAHGLGDYEEIE